jgi:hypothetical protein
MVIGSHKRGGRSITLAAAGLLTLTVLASCGGNSAAPSPSHPAAVVPTDQAATPAPPGATSEVRLGCATYCQDAGGLAGTLDSGRDAVTIVSSGTVTPDADNYLPVTVTCNLRVQCRGSLVVQPNFGPSDPDTGRYLLGRSDLLLGPGATATFGVQLPAGLLPYIPARQPPCTVPEPGMSICPNAITVIADTGPTFGCAGRAEKTGLPFCRGPVNGFRVVSTGGFLVLAAR